MSGEITLNDAERAKILAHSAKFDPPGVTAADGRRDLVGMSRDELSVELAAIGLQHRDVRRFRF